MGIISYELQYYVDKYGDIAGGGTYICAYIEKETRKRNGCYSNDVSNHSCCQYNMRLYNSASCGTAVVIITGIALGPEAGVLTGALARFVCNFFMGQGIWTPWEMVAWAMLGGLAGVFFL